MPQDTMHGLVPMHVAVRLALMDAIIREPTKQTLLADPYDASTIAEMSWPVGHVKLRVLPAVTEQSWQFER